MASNITTVLGNSFPQNFIYNKVDIENEIGNTQISLKQKIHNRAKKGFSTFSSSFGFVSKGIKLFSSTFTVITQSGKWITAHANTVSELKMVLTYLKLISIFKISISLSKIPTSFKKLIKSVQLKDHEGTFLSGVKCSLAVGEVIKSITTLGKTLLFCITKASIKTFVWITPFGYTLDGISGTTKCYDLFKTLKFKHVFEKKFLSKITKMQLSSAAFIEELNPFLNVHLGSEEKLTPVKLSRKYKITVLERKTSKAITAKFIEISKLLKSTEDLTLEKSKKIVVMLKGIKNDLRKESFFKAGAVFTSIISGVATGILYTPVVPIVPSLLSLVCVLTQLILKVCHNKFSKENRC